MYHCSCGLKVIGNQCPGRLTWIHEKHYQISSDGPDLIKAVIATNWIDSDKQQRAKVKSMTVNEEKYADFYNKELLSGTLDTMSDEEMRIYREQLEDIALEAKARVNAVNSKIREKEAKLRVSQKEWLETRQPSQGETDAINSVKIRKDRMTKLDKQRENLENLGMDKSVIDEIMRTFQSKVTENGVKSIKDKPESKPDIKPKTETAKVETKPAEPFNPDDLFS